MEICKTLNDQQREAVLKTTGPVMIAAGPGTGKTATLVNRIIYIIAEKAVPSEHILAVTFTNKAASELKGRIMSIAGRDAESLTVGTFHSICFDILQKEIHNLGYSHNFSIYNELERREVLYYLLENNSWLKERYSSAKRLSVYISKIKNMQIDTGEEPELEKAYNLYQSIMKDSNALDLDDLIILTNKLFNTFPSVLQRYHKRFHYIMVDEYQDINPPQYLFISKLAEEKMNICVIGDADQAIYSFRGANVENFLHFKKDYSNASLIMLEQNYRSSPAILNAASNMISNNSKRLNTVLWTENRWNGFKVMVMEAMNEKEEARMVVREIERLMGGTSFNAMDSTKRGISSEAYSVCFSDFCVLYRTHSLRKPLKNAFFNAGIPFQSVDGNGLYESQEVKTILSYLRAIYNPDDDMTIVNIIKHGSYGIGEKTVAAVLGLAKDKGGSFFKMLKNIDGIEEFTTSQKKTINNFVSSFNRMQEFAFKHRAADVIKYIFDHLSIGETDTAKGSQECMGDIEDLLCQAAGFSSCCPRESVERLLKDTSLYSAQDGYNSKAKAVTLTTIHGAKGLEFPVVFICGVEDGIIPYQHLDKVSDEEERRLFYVAMTRAKERLYCLHTRKRFIYGRKVNSRPSPFLGEISEDWVEYIKTKERPALKRKKSQAQMSIFD